MADHGRFSGDPQTEWVTEDGAEDRRMRLIETFWFRDPGGKKWVAAAGAVVDGASIPRALWTTVGSPYTGDYRRASIVHDVACVEAAGDEDKRRAADRMFFHACRTGGCSIWQATTLYVGVRIGAAAPDVQPWRAAAAINMAGPRLRRGDAELQMERDFQDVADRVHAAGETDDPLEIERRTDDALLTVAAFERPAAAPKRRRAASRRRPRAGGRRSKPSPPRRTRR
jgi:hypothetical protein